METEQVQWGNDAWSVVVRWSADAAPWLASVRAGDLELELPANRPLVEVLTVRDGHVPAVDRLVQTAIGRRARYAGHREVVVDGGQELVVTVADPVTGLRAEVCLELADHVAALRSHVRVVNDGTEPAVLRAVVSFAAHLGRPVGSAAPGGIRGWTVRRALSEWMAEGRWFDEPCDPSRFPPLGPGPTAHTSKSARPVVSTGTWSTGTHLPVAAAVNAAAGVTWAWQIEHNGPWRYELGDDVADGYLALSGPTDADHQWLKTLRPGDAVESVPVTVTVAPDFTAAVGHLTRHRRARRRPHPDHAAPKVVFNDYMNTLDGDPTTERLLPLVDAAAAVGAEVFCIDAGWYDDSGHWWDSVGEWRPSRTRFPGGLGEVIDRIRSHGMTAGLWLEPEVVGVRSPVADLLPAEAFLLRSGQRVVEHDRYHLDLRHPAARAHLDAVVDRLVGDFGVGYFKLDYNVDPGAGTDHDADSAGDGLLGHNRAHLAWLDGVLDRHPGLVLENCGSGAMRADPAVLSRLQLQSTSDQEDPLRYPPIAAAAPAAMLPEQAASWAYPQPGMTAEEAAFTLVTGLSGRLYLSGYLNRMAPDLLALVTEAVELAKRLRTPLSSTLPFWPLGLPGWEDPCVALGLAGPTGTHLFVWSRDPSRPEAALDLSGAPGLAPGAGLHVEQVFPAALPAWTSGWSAADRTLRVRNDSGTAAARVFSVGA